MAVVAIGRSCRPAPSARVGRDRDLGHAGVPRRLPAAASPSVGASSAAPFGNGRPGRRRPSPPSFPRSVPRPHRCSPASPPRASSRSRPPRPPRRLRRRPCRSPCASAGSADSSRRRLRFAERRHDAASRRRRPAAPPSFAAASRLAFAIRPIGSLGALTTLAAVRPFASFRALAALSPVAATATPVVAAAFAATFARLTVLDRAARPTTRVLRRDRRGARRRDDPARGCSGAVPASPRRRVPVDVRDRRRGPRDARRAHRARPRHAAPVAIATATSAAIAPLGTSFDLRCGRRRHDRRAGGRCRSPVLPRRRRTAP